MTLFLIEGQALDLRGVGDHRPTVRARNADREITSLRSNDLYLKYVVTRLPTQRTREIGQFLPHK